jgi:hypothetical protein
MLLHNLCGPLGAIEKGNCSMFFIAFGIGHMCIMKKKKEKRNHYQYHQSESDGRIMAKGGMRRWQTRFDVRLTDTV